MRKPKPLTHAQEKVMGLIPEDGSWVLIDDLNTTIASSAVIRGLVSRGLIEHRKKNPDSEIAYLEWITEGEVRRVVDGNPPASVRPKKKFGYQVVILIQKFSFDPKVGSAVREIVDSNVKTTHGDWRLGDWDTAEKADAAVASLVHGDGDACGGACAKGDRSE